MLVFLFPFLALLSAIYTQSKRATYVPDVSINRKLFLDNYRSGDAFYRCKVEEDGFRETPYYLYESSDFKQYLICYQYEGNTTHNFSQFEFGYVDTFLAKHQSCQTKER